MGSVLPISSGAMGERQGLGFWVEFFCLFLHFAHFIFCLRLFVGTVPWNTDTLRRHQLWGDTDLGPFCCPLVGVPWSQAQNRAILEAIFSLNKSCQVSSPWKTSAYQHHAVCMLTAGKDSSSHSVKEISFSPSYSVPSLNNVPNVQFLPFHSRNHYPSRK